MKNKETQPNREKTLKKKNMKTHKYIEEEEGEGQVRIQSGFVICRWEEPETNDSQQQLLCSFGAKCYKKRTPRCSLATLGFRLRLAQRARDRSVFIALMQEQRSAASCPQVDLDLSLKKKKKKKPETNVERKGDAQTSRRIGAGVKTQKKNTHQ